MENRPVDVTDPLSASFGSIMNGSFPQVLNLPRPALPPSTGLHASRREFPSSQPQPVPLSAADPQPCASNGCHYVLDAILLQKYAHVPTLSNDEALHLAMCNSARPADAVNKEAAALDAEMEHLFYCYIWDDMPDAYEMPESPGRDFEL